MKRFIYPLVLLLTFVTCHSYAASSSRQVSPQQIAQFKKLSPAQQRTLAQSLGVDISVLQSQINTSPAQIKDNESQSQQYYPRGTQFDEFGNPLFSNEPPEQEKEDDDEPKPFGYDVFANAPNTFFPSVDIAIPDNYMIGSGDTVLIQIFGKENQDFELAVSREGQIVLPQLGPFSVSGLTFVEMKSYLTEAIKSKVLGVDVVITLSKLRSLRVFVLGDAFKPGQYVLSALSSITHALFSAGGINDIGSLRNIQLKRAGQLVTTLDLYDLLINGDSSNDLLLKSGDVIFVAPVGERVTVSGEVRRPAIYELATNETFASVIKMAGGLLPSSYPSSTVVERYNDQNLRSLLNVDLTEQMSLTKKVRGGDFIRVMKTSDLFDQSVTIIGAVSRPGKYQWTQNQKISDLLPNIHSYLLSDADLSYSLIVREKDAARNIEVLQFSLANIASSIEASDNIPLQAHDKILIFSNTEKHLSDSINLDSLALTEEEILKKEKQNAKDQYNERIFWENYGTDAQIKEKDALDESLELASKTLVELTGGQAKEDIDVKLLGHFSRKRLLTPVIEQLTRQSAAGEPVQLTEVVGAVKYPGIYPLANDGKVVDLLKAAGGLLESAYTAKADITRNTIINENAAKQSLSVNLDLALQRDNTNNVVLQSKDRLNILQIPAWQENHIVELRGEFMFPGKYTIRRGEKLAQLVARAGGFTEYAYIEASVFTREKLKQLELQNLLKVSESLRMEIASKSLAQTKGSQMVDYQQAKLLLADLTKVKPIGRLVVDLPKVKKDPNFDVLLENGDILYVPTKQNSINVIGQVQVATSHLYQSGLSASDYLNLSGGVKMQADEDRIYIIKANGSVEIPSQGNWFASNSGGELAPGDTIVVPLDSDYMDNLTLWSTGTQIIYQAAVAVAAIAGI